jgi:hypothetical protein
MTPPLRIIEADGQVYRIEGTPVTSLLTIANYRRRGMARPCPLVRKVVPGPGNWTDAIVNTIIVTIVVAPLLIVVLTDGLANTLGLRSIVARVTALLFLLGVVGVTMWSAAVNITDRTVFDRHAGRAGRRWLFGTVWAVDLEEVVAVQCLHAGWFPLKNADWREHFQLNLVVKAEAGDRLHVGDVGKEEWVRSLAEELASFLEVPLVDQIEETRTPKPPLREWL